MSLTGTCPTCNGMADVYPNPSDNHRGHVYCSEDDCGWIHRDIANINRFL